MIGMEFLPEDKGTLVQDKDSMKQCSLNRPIDYLVADYIQPWFVSLNATADFNCII